jgi:hypothetical protein
MTTREFTRLLERTLRYNQGTVNDSPKLQQVETGECIA